MPKIDLRDYQQDIINQTINSDKSTLIQVPTGGGKTIIAKEIIKYLTNNLNQQVLFVAPKIILMEQTAEVFKSLNPHVVHGINQYDKNHKVLVSTIQTASRRDINPDVIIIDEIHYGFDGKMIERLIKDKPNTKIIGLSATPYDKNGEQLKRFELILDKYDMKYMVENKYLVNIESHVLTEIRKLDTVKITGGDYNIQELSKIVCNNQTILEIVGSTAEHILKYKKAIVFAVDINHAELLTKAYQHEGFVAKVLHSNLSKKEQETEIDQFEKGRTKILVSVLMLTTGFDVPDTDVAIIARPTKSQNLYKQMVGRVLRLAPNKTHAILLDCGNVIENLGMPLDPIKANQKKEIADNQQKCELCESKNLKLKHKDEKSFWECQDCGHVRNIEHGTYECKSCHKLYAYARDRFSIKSNKLYLNCDNCPYPTFISEYTGSEIFVEITDKTEEKINPNKSLVKILEEKKKKEELEREEAKALIQREKQIQNQKYEIATLEKIQEFERRQKNKVNETISLTIEERKAIISEKLQKIENDKKNNTVEKRKEKIEKEKEEEKIKTEKEKIEKEKKLKKKREEIDKNALYYFEISLKTRLSSCFKSKNIDLQIYNDDSFQEQLLEKINTFQKRIFNEFEQYQIDIVEESFNLENFLEDFKLEICEDVGQIA